MHMTTTLQPASARDTYLNAFTDVEADLAQTSRPAVMRLRKAAIARFGEIGFPNERNEDWKFTNLAPLLRTPFVLPPQDNEEAADTYCRLLHHDEPGTALLSVNANRPFLLRESTSLPAGVLVMSLGEALEAHPELVERHLGQHADFKSHPFVALNTAFWRDGAFVFVPPGVVVEEPINLVHQIAAFHDGPPYLWYRRVLLVLGRGSQATVIERFNGPSIVYGTSTVTESVVEEGAHLDHCKVQEESLHAYHVAVTKADVARSGRFSTHYVGLGGQLARNEVRVLFTGEGGEATVNGLYRAAGTQHADNHTVIDHAKAHCASHELYKGILDGKARAVFNGKIFVRQDAQKTDAKQTNQTLLLSDDATINTKPQLEIFADDVKCTHGATVGQLDAEQLFYLRSRGVGLEEARNLLTYAFANDVVERIRVARLREQLEAKLLASSHLPQA
jgi:Fe-S cluster assembly protein SufD